MEEQEGWERLFDEGYYSYPHPFRRGDILLRTGEKDTLYIVDMDKDPEKETERVNRLASFGDYTDIGIRTTTISKRSGRIWDMDEPLHPFVFEYACLDERTEDVIEQAALEIQHLMRGGRGSLQYIYDACLRRKEDCIEATREPLTTGIRLRPYSTAWEWADRR